MDLQRLNLLIVDEQFPLPRVDDSLMNLGIVRPVWFSSLDLLSCLWQIKLNDSSKTVYCFLYT